LVEYNFLKLFKNLLLRKYGLIITQLKSYKIEIKSHILLSILSKVQWKLDLANTDLAENLDLKGHLSENLVNHFFIFST